MTGSQWIKCLGLLFAWGVLCLAAGCNPRFYMSESEVAAYHANALTDTRANNLLAGFNGKTVRLDFQTVGGRPAIRQSNLADTLRTVPNLFVLEQLFRQIRLDRMATQVEDSLEDWIADSLELLSKGTDARIRIRPLRRATVTFLSAPTVTYNRTAQTVSFSLEVRLQLRGTLHIRRLDGLLRDLLGWLISDSSHPLILTIDHFVITGDFRMLPHSGGRLYARFFPQPGPVTVQGNMPSEIRDGARNLSRQKFGAPVREVYDLTFDYFALSDFRLDTADELQFRYRPRPEVTAPSIHVVAVGEDDRIYHTIGQAGRWGPQKVLPFNGRYRFPVALVPSGPDQLEMLTVTGWGEFSHASWRQGRWQNLYTSDGDGPFGPYDGYQPALVATAPGQIEAVLKGTDGRLYHVRRLDGRWRPAVQVPIHPSLNVRYPLRHPQAVQSGNKIVLAFVDDRSRPWAMLFDMETGFWDHPIELQGPGAFSAPAMAACGDEGRVHLVYNASDHTVFHRELTAPIQNITAATGVGISVGPLTDLGGHLTSAPAVACSGQGQLQVVGRGANNRLQHIQYRSPRTSSSGRIHDRQVPAGWQNWEAVSEQYFGSLFAAAVDGNAVGMAASRNGEVHLIARQYGSSHNLIHNAYDGSRFGHAPWKAVHWRGAWRIAGRSFHGRPAVAVLDRQLHLVSRNQNGHLIHTPLAVDHAARFQAVANTQHPYKPDPVLLAPTPRSADLLAPNSAGRIAHVRWINGASYQHHTLPEAAGTTFNAPATAVRLGAGGIEAVAVAQNGMIFHWRFLNGDWEPPAVVGGPVLSLPALVNLGAGRLLVLAVGQDLKLHRWRFENAGWSHLGAIRTGFNVKAAMFGPPSVDSWGDGTVDAALVDDATGTVYHQSLNAGANASTQAVQAFPAGYAAADAPVLSAHGPDDLHLLVRGSDSRVYASQTRYLAGPGGFRYLFSGCFFGTLRSQSPPGPQLQRRSRLAWDRPQPISQKTPVLLGPVARLGDGTMAAAATAADGRIFLTRYDGHRWSIFMPMVGQSAAALQTPPLSRPVLIAD